MGGGSLIAVHNSLTSKLILQNDNNLESVFVMIEFPSATVILGCTYITNLHKTENVYTLIHHLKQIEDLHMKHPNCKFIIIGDYNLPNIVWSKLLPSSFKQKSYCEPQILNSADRLNITANPLEIIQLAPHHPMKNYTLDLCFSEKNFLKFIESENIIELVPYDSHHIPLLFEFDIKSLCSVKQNDKFLLFRANDIEKFNSFLLNTDFSFLDYIASSKESENNLNLNLNIIFEKFYNIILNAILFQSPLVTIA